MASALLKIRAVVVDDDELVRAGIADWLSTIEGVEVVGDAGDCDQALKVLSETNATMLLADVMLPGVSGIEVVKKAKRVYPDLTCVVLSGALSADLVIDSFAAGSVAYLTKSISPDELKVALSQISEGNWYISPEACEIVMTRAIEQRQLLAKRAPEEVTSQLTDRERELLKMIAEGYTFQQISEHLDCSSRSVERMKSRLQDKIGSANLVDLIRKAIKLELIQL